MPKTFSRLALCFIIYSSFIFDTNAATHSTSSYLEIDKDKVVSSAFGIVTSFNYNQIPIIVPSKEIPLISGQSYGWIIELKTNKPNIKWREEFTLPVKPSTWGDEPTIGSRIITNNGKTSLIEQETYGTNGIIFHSWSVAKGDPKGIYAIRVFSENKLIGSFEFNVK